jgi:hypothetical protein
MTLLVCGVLLPVIAIAGLVVALSSSKSHASQKAVAHTTTLSARDQARQAYDECMKSMGASRPPRGGGRFGGGFSSSSFNKFRQASSVCSTVLRNAGQVPTQTVSSANAPAA